MCVQVIRLAEHVCDGDAGQVLAPFALDRVDVEEDQQGGEETHEHQQEDADLQALQVHVGAAEAEVRRHRQSEKKTKRRCRLKTF